MKQQLELCADVILLLEEQCDSRLHIPSSGSPTLLILGSSFNNCMHRIISVFVLQAMVTVAWYPAPFYARAGDEATVTAAELSPGPAPSGERGTSEEVGSW